MCQNTLNTNVFNPFYLFHLIDLLRYIKILVFKIKK